MPDLCVNGDYFVEFSWASTKSKAIRKAKNMRAKGYYVRIVKTLFGTYNLYRREKDLPHTREYYEAKKHRKRVR